MTIKEDERLAKMGTARTLLARERERETVAELLARRRTLSQAEVRNGDAGWPVLKDDFFVRKRTGHDYAGKKVAACALSVSLSQLSNASCSNPPAGLRLRATRRYGISQVPRFRGQTLLLRNSRTFLSGIQRPCRLGPSPAPTGSPSSKEASRCSLLQPVCSP